MRCPECEERLVWSNDFDGDDENSPTIESIWCCDDCDITVIKIWHLDDVAAPNEDKEE